MEDLSISRAVEAAVVQTAVAALHQISPEELAGEAQEPLQLLREQVSPRQVEAAGALQRGMHRVVTGVLALSSFGLSSLLTQGLAGQEAPQGVRRQTAR